MKVQDLDESVDFSDMSVFRWPVVYVVSRYERYIAYSYGSERGVCCDLLTERAIDFYHEYEHNNVTVPEHIISKVRDGIQYKIENKMGAAKGLVQQYKGIDWNQMVNLIRKKLLDFNKPVKNGDGSGTLDLAKMAKTIYYEIIDVINCSHEDVVTISSESMARRYLCDFRQMDPYIYRGYAYFYECYTKEFIEKMVDSFNKSEIYKGIELI